MILLEYRDRDTNDINCICSLSSFVEEDNYDDLEKDIAKIKNLLGLAINFAHPLSYALA